ncbi:MAG: hypothetical protein P8Y66_10455 [Nitrospirota bacterium]|jgi:hypothetical protein
MARFIPFVLALLLAVPASALARGGGGPSEGAGGMGGPGMGGMHEERGGPMQGQGMGMTSRQQGHFRSWSDMGRQVRSEAGALGEAARKGGLRGEEGRKLLQSLSGHVRQMQEEHRHFAESLNDAQRERVRRHLQNMERIRRRVEDRMQMVQQEMDRGGQGDRIAGHARQMEQDMDAWQREHREMESALK